MFGFGKGHRRPKVAPETLQEQIDALEGSFRSLKLEWTDTYDKLYRLAGRMDASRKFAGERTPAITNPEKGPENGPEALIEQPIAQEAPPRPRGTRSELLASWKT